MKPTVVSIYSGCGGIDIGFEKAGFSIEFATDYWEPSTKTLKHSSNAKEVLCEDIQNINFQDVLQDIEVTSIDCLVGGPPCPAYSKSRFYRKEKKRGIDDETYGFTLKEYFRAVEELSPKIFFFENVHGFVYKPHQSALQYLQDECQRLGYEISLKVINAANYGVPQTRERVIIIGCKTGLKPFVFPDETHTRNLQKKENSDKKPWVTCGDVISDIDFYLPEDKNMQAGSKHKHLLKEIPPGDNYLFFTTKRGHPNPQFKWRSRYWSFLLKLSPNRPSWTIQASHSNNMGPFHWKNRFLRIPEIKRIQTFDDDYEILGSFKDQWRQIGNAVPPLLSNIIAEEIKKQYFVEDSNREDFELNQKLQLTEI